MKSKIYEKNDFNKYYNKNDEFNELNFPEFIKNSISNKIIPKSSFKVDQERDSLYSRNNNNNSHYDTNHKRSFMINDRNPYPYHEENNTNLYNENYVQTQENKLDNLNDVNSYNFKQKSNNISGFSKFLEKKNLYDRLADLRDSIGIKKLNSPFMLLPHENNFKSSDFFNKLTNTSPNEYFVQSPKMLRSLVSINNKDSFNTNDEHFHLKRTFSSFKSQSSNLRRSNGNFDFINKDKYDFKNIDNIHSPLRKINNYPDSKNFNYNECNKTKELNKSSIGINLRSPKNELGLLAKEPSRVNILHKIEQFKDYLRYKGL